ncbi:rNA polymerase sigma factor [Clostridium sp. CAG:575]|nr:rNA polymerase sigma factor [Clostridium sp. CAG:575]
MYENSISSIKRAQDGDNFEMERLIRENNGLIWSIVKRFMNRGYEVDDLYQIGCIGFIKSIKRFDTNFDVKLSTYSVPYILGEIKRFIRDDGPIKVSRSIKELNTKINELKKYYLIKYGREITIEEIKKELKVTKEDILIAIDSVNNVESIENAATSENKDGKKLSIMEKISTGKNEEEIITNKLVIRELIEDLKDRDRQIILLRFFKEKTQTEVANMLGISQVQVSRIEKKVLSNMRKKLTSA